MKSSTLLISFLIFGFVLFQACKKEEEQPVNDDPVCTIIVPNEGQEFTVGETITISINASDADGSIKDISILVNDDQIATLSTSPSTYFVAPQKDRYYNKVNLHSKGNSF